MIKCRLCGGDYKSIEMHLTTCLKKHSITREQYDALGDESTDDLADNVQVIDNEVIDKGISQKEVISNIFKGVPKQIDLARPFGEVIEEYGITEKEFVALVNQWKGQKEIPIEMKIKKNLDMGNETAEKYKDLTDVEVDNVYTAEVLVKKYGFECVAVKSATIKTPKTWVLKKMKVV